MSCDQPNHGPNPITQAVNLSAKINGLTQVLTAATLLNDTDMNVAIPTLAQHLRAAQAELTALTSLYGG